MRGQELSASASAATRQTDGVVVEARDLKRRYSEGETAVEALQYE